MSQKVRSSNWYDVYIDNNGLFDVMYYFAIIFILHSVASSLGVLCMIEYI